MEAQSLIVTPLPVPLSLCTCLSNCSRLQVCRVAHTNLHCQLSKGLTAPSPTSLELCNFNDEVDELDRNHFHENKKKIWDAVEIMVSTSHALPEYSPPQKGCVNDTIHKSDPANAAPKREEYHSSTSSRKSPRTRETNF